jgi:hypothetical protein
MKKERLMFSIILVFFLFMILQGNALAESCLDFEGQVCRTTDCGSYHNCTDGQGTCEGGKHCCEGTCTEGGGDGTCTDSDGGPDPYTKGTTTYSGYTAIDSCENQYQLEEHFCVNGAHRGDIFECTNGCENGACIRDVTEGENDSCASVGGQCLASCGEHMNLLLNTGCSGDKSKCCKCKDGYAWGGSQGDDCLASGEGGGCLQYKGQVCRTTNCGSYHNCTDGQGTCEGGKHCCEGTCTEQDTFDTNKDGNIDPEEFRKNIREPVSSTDHDRVLNFLKAIVSFFNNHL